MNWFLQIRIGNHYVGANSLATETRSRSQSENYFDKYGICRIFW